MNSKSGIDWTKVLIKAAIGGVIGALGGLVVSIVSKKRKQV